LIPPLATEHSQSCGLSDGLMSASGVPAADAPINDTLSRHPADGSRPGIIIVYAVMLAFNIGTWAWALAAFAGHPVLLGTAFLAYSFGLRHAFDADHIAAIDNVVRKLVQENLRPYSVGAYFSLGHSTVVVVASIAIALTASGINERLGSIHVVGGVVGTVVSAGFLLVVGFANLLVLRDIWIAFSRARRTGGAVQDDIGGLASGSGIMTRLLRWTFALVSRSWHMYPVGLLFGLGFDTATEIGVLGISAAQATQGTSFWTILVFPMLFTAGMSIMDFTDSVLMTRAYGWASIDPIRKLWYNMTITATSVIVALFIGGLEALGLIVDKLRLSGWAWNAIRELNGDVGLLGFCIVGFFAISWIASYLIFQSRAYGNW
jgi:high-affinity nickel-transport protein